MRVKDNQQIQKLMVIQNASSRQVAKACGWQSHSYVTRILRGEITTVTPERAARMARFFGVGVDDLFVPRLSSDPARSAKKQRVA